MKKLLFIVSAVAVLATGTVFGIKAYQNSQHPMTDLMRQNLEALSDGEGLQSGQTIACFETVSSGGDGGLVAIPYCGCCCNVPINLGSSPSFCTVP